VVTSTQPAEAKNFGRETHFEHSERYERAHEFTEIVCALWDSWDDDAFPRNKKTGEFLDPEKLHSLNHKGRFFSVRGPLNVPRSPQGYPVLVQAGVSPEARRFAAEFAEVIFSSHLTKQQSTTYYEQVKGDVGKFGRAPSDIKIMPGLNPVVGRTSAEADEKLEFLNSLIEPIVAREILSMFLGVDLSNIPFDEPFPEVKPTEKSSGSFHNWVSLAKQEKLTLRQLAFRAARGRMSVVKGSPAEIADHMEDWFRGGACDGFNIMPPYLPGAFDDFVELVVPELQRRGLFRTEYDGRTYREHLGLRRPDSRYAQSPAKSSAVV
jgi:alkanesulfonate monooxygenase